MSQTVSIIVLTHNNLQYTRQCVEALKQTTEDYELVIVDNASSDRTSGYLRELEAAGDATVIFNQRNEGFAAGCNQGVASAGNELICLLNNDTVPREGWLDAMREALQHRVGIVGSKLLLLDGTLQHAGIEFQYCMEPKPHFWPLHRFLREPGDTPEANVLEEVPAVTGACLLTTKDVWTRVGGMDEGYAVANFEDLDFNLAVRDQGMKVVYQPASELLHYWGTTVSSMERAPDSPARYFDSNFDRFTDKWFNRLRRRLARV